MDVWILESKDIMKYEQKSGNVKPQIPALCLCLVSEHQSVSVRIHDDGFRPVDMLCQHGLRQVVQQVTLDGPFDRTGTELGIITRIGQEVQGASVSCKVTPLPSSIWVMPLICRRTTC